MDRESKSITFSFIFSLVVVLSTIQTEKLSLGDGTAQFLPASLAASDPSKYQSLPKILNLDMENKDQSPQSIAQTYPAEISKYSFHDPAGCSPSVPADLSPQAMLDNVQIQIGGSLDLKARSINYVWNGSLGTHLDISEDPYVYEFEINEFQPPFTYRADGIVTSFVQNGFAVWLRSYGDKFRLLAVSMSRGVELSLWADYVDAYWRKDGLPDDELIIPVSKKLPCHWMIDQNYVNDQELGEIFNLDWQIPDYLGAGRNYLAESCSEAYRVSQEEIGYWDATSVCGPLTWQITHDANSFPYRIGSYDADADLFINANPRYWGNRPWIGFDPQTYDLIKVGQVMAGFEFETIGGLNPGDLVFSYGSPDQWTVGGGYFSHIFLVAGTDDNNSRLAITNLVKNHCGEKDCSISEVVLYTPGDRSSGVINNEWNDHGYGITGRYGFDVFRWKWIIHYQEGRSREYEVRWGETVETIAFDWKVSPESIIEVNILSSGAQLEPEQVIILPAPGIED